MDWLATAEITRVSRPIEEILKARKIKDIDAFLNPKREDLYNSDYDPFLMKDMGIGVARIADAIQRGELILIEGDYDADGVTSTSIFVMGLQDLGADVTYHIPLRKEGYGLSKNAVDIAVAKGVQLIVTCDNGIAAFEAVDYAKSLGIDIVITDHHKPQETIPSAFAVINPQQVDCPYPTKELAGCGVVFKVLQALNQFIHGDSRKAEKYLEIVCIGTVGDVMKLVGENRLITKYGLEKLVGTENKGLEQLLRALCLDDKARLTTNHLGFQIVPCLNAAGRLGDAALAVEMLTTNSKRNAYRTAVQLRDANEERKKLTELWATKIVKNLEENYPEMLDSKVMVIPYEEEIPEGLVGLLAGKLKTRYQKPIILLTPLPEEPGILKGSGRSIFAYDMFAQILPHKDLCEKFGGHDMACGLSIKEENVEAFAKAINKSCTLTEDDLKPKLYIDYEIEPELITKQFVYELNAMEPFGNGNQKPLFLLRDVFVTGARGIGQKEQHLKFQGQCNDEFIDMIGWSMYEKWDTLGKPDEVDVAFYPGLNTWNGRTNVQLELQDIREAQE